MKLNNQLKFFMQFTELKIDSSILQALNDMKIISSTDIQTQAIPIMLNSPAAHIMGQAKTGTGKTLAFAIPIVQLLDYQAKSVQAVILVPTRELCKQVSGVFAELAKYKLLKIVEVYGGVSIKKQIQEIHNGGQIIIATPGRLIDIYKQGKIKFTAVKFVTLDEADRMLDMGFFPDIEYILLRAMKGVQPRMMLFSATLADEIKSLAKKFTRENNLVEINVSRDELTVEDCNQYYYVIRESDKKYAHFIEIINETQPKDMIIFVRTKHWADKLYRNIRSEKQLKLDFFKAGVLHGDLSQSKREFIMRQFNEQEINCLIATNVAARGLDFTQVSHVFNYDFPDRGDAVDEYVHRIGRTARIDCKNNGITTKGIAISLVLKNQLDVLKDIEVKIKRKLVQKSLPEIKEIHEYNDPQFKRVQRSNQIHRKHSNNKGVHANRHDTNNKNNKNNKNYKNNKNPKTHSDQGKKIKKSDKRINVSRKKRKTSIEDNKITTKVYPLK